MDQAHADEPSVVIDALDDISVQLELGDDGGREVNPAGMQLGKSDRLVAGPAQSLQQPLLLAVSERHRRIVALHRDRGRLEHFPAALVPLDVFASGRLVAAHRYVPSQSNHAQSDRDHYSATLPRWTPGQLARIP